MTSDMEGLRPYACLKTYDRVVEIFHKYPREGKLLEIAAGEGILALKLKELGYEVTACDLFPQNFKVPSIPCQYVNLHEKFPFRDQEFEYVVCVEAIEHLEDQFFFIRECRRILKKGGKILLTTPNILNLASRIKYLLTGFFPLFPLLDEMNRSPVHDHINPVAYYRLRYILHTNGFRVIEMTTDRVRRSALAWYWLYPFVWLFTGITVGSKKDEVKREILSREMLLGRTLIVVAEKQ